MLALQIAISILMTFAGGAKLLGAKAIAEQFDEFGLPPLAMRLIGLLEVSLAVAIQVSAMAPFAGALLCLLMVGALGQHLKVRHPPQKSLPAVVALLLGLAHSVLAVSGGALSGA